jgi:S1-C subfamily serine protease
VVERTIQQVAPATADQPAKTTTTVVVSEEDQVLQSITKNEKSIVRLKTLGSDGSQVVAGIGLVVSNDGVIVIDPRSYVSTSPYWISFYDGNTYPTGSVYVDNDDNLVFIKTNIPQNQDTKYTFYPAIFGDSDVLKIGQTLITISGNDSNAASVGRIFQLAFGNDKKTVTNILSDIKISKANLGSPALDLSGEIVGIEAPFSDTNTQYSYTPINVVKAATIKALAQLTK